MKHIICFLILFISQNCISQTPPKFEHFEIDLDTKRENFFDAVAHIEIIRLEETKNSLLAPFRSYFDTPSGIGIVEKETNTIVLFDDKGNYKNVINRYGRGPEEYINITDAFFHEGKIKLFSAGSRNMQLYTEEGEYIETLRTKYNKEIYGGSMVPYKNGYLFQRIDPSNINTNFSFDALIFTDRELNMIGTGATNANPHLIPWNAGKRFQFIGDSLFYKKQLNDSIFQIIDSKVFPRFKFDFGNEWAWSDPESMMTFNNGMKTIGRGEKVYEVIPDVGKKYIMLDSYIFENHQKGYINRQTGKYHRFDMRKKDKENYEIKFHKWEGERLAASIAVYDFEEFIGNLEADQWNIRGGFSLNEILSSENPVLLKIKFKNKMGN